MFSVVGDYIPGHQNGNNMKPPLCPCPPDRLIPPHLQIPLVCRGWKHCLVAAMDLHAALTDFDAGLMNMCDPIWQKIYHTTDALKTEGYGECGTGTKNLLHPASHLQETLWGGLSLSMHGTTCTALGAEEGQKG